MAHEAIEPAGLEPPAPPGDRRPEVEDLRFRLLSGSAIMLLSSVLVGVVNLAYNFAVAHELGAARFGHASVVYTVLMLLSSVTLSFQLLCSKFVARSESQQERISIYRMLHRRSWLWGLGLGAALAAAGPAIAGYLHLPSPLLVEILALGIVFYVPLGTRRGFMQGTYDFVPLAMSYVLEVMVKLVGAVAVISSGWGVAGVVGAITASVIAAYLVAIPRKQRFGRVSETKLRADREEGIQTLVFFIGQVIINNLDIVLVKHFFAPTQAGVYAAIALIGRVVYILTWSVVSSMFPFSAGARSEERGGRTVLTTALLLTSGISALFILGTWAAPAHLWPTLLGRGFPAGGARFYSSLLVLYALSTAVYSLSVVIMTYEISRKVGHVSWLQLAFSGGIVAGIYVFHETLAAVITVQLVLMMVMLFVVSVPFLAAAGRAEPAGAGPAVPRSLSRLRKTRRVDENEVIAEFLHGEFYQEEFRRYRKRFSLLVSQPDLSNEQENQLRRALLFRRRGRLWGELPPNTEWWEVEPGPAEFERIRVFPRNQWLRYGAPNFLLPATVERIRARILSCSSDSFIEKLRSLSIQMKANANSKFNTVILISIDEYAPMTIIEGNHRMTAAMLGTPEDVHTRFRFLCGFSPNMAECCWYQTDISSLWRYAKNTVAYYLKHRRKIAAEIAA